MVYPAPYWLIFAPKALIVSIPIFLYSWLSKIFPNLRKLYAETELPLGIAPSYTSLDLTIKSSECSS